MKKVSILAATALVAVGCNKKPLEMPAAPVYPDMEAPVSFGATADVEVTPSKAQSTVPTSQKLGVFAFKADTHPTTNGSDEADNALWCEAENKEYTWQSDAFAENGTKTLFWPGTGTADSKLSFTSYFPYQSDGVNSYVLTKSLKNQSAAPDYGFAWASLDGVERPKPVSAQELNFTYKIAKITFSIVGDDEGTVGAGGITATDVKSIKIYSAGKGLYENYKLDLLTGTSSGTTDIQQGDPMVLKGVEQEGGMSKPSNNKYVEAVAYVAPSVESELKSNGITVEIVHNDGVSDQTYTATINSSTNGLQSDDAKLANGLVEGKNYKYTLKLGKSGITFTGKVTDWTDVEGGEVDLQ